MIAKGPILFHALRRSHLVPTIHPIEPISNGFLGFYIFRQWPQLRQRHSNPAPVPLDPDKHFALAFLFRCHAEDFTLALQP